MSDYDYSQHVDRASSWYRDMVAQAEQAGTNLQDILGPGAGGDGVAEQQQRQQQQQQQQQQHVKRADSANSEVQNNDEVLEQYRIMALFKAKQHLYKNTGQNLQDQEKTRKEPASIFPIKKPQRQRPTLTFHGESKPKSQNPNQGEDGGDAGSAEQIEKYDELKLPPPRYNRRYLDKRGVIKPVQCKGIYNQNIRPMVASDIADDEHLVRCLRCQSLLAVKKLATLVSCSECSSVSPVSRAQ